jgi:uncharacterized membrane protein YsdA (DUF1294 family)
VADLFQWLRWIHIAAGSVALMLFWIPAIAPKGGRTHVRAGWAYVIGMSIVVVTAFSMSGLAFGFPLEVRHFQHPIPLEEQASFIHSARISAAFLGYLAALTLMFGWRGVWAALTKRNPQEMRKPFTIGLYAAVFLGGIAIFLLGLREHEGPLMGLGPVGPFATWGSLKYALHGPKSRMHWWYEHIGGMLGTAIAGYTAFLVFGGSRMFSSVLHGQMYTILWVLPTILGVPAIYITTRYFRRKFNENGPGAHQWHRAPARPPE